MHAQNLQRCPVERLQHNMNYQKLPELLHAYKTKYKGDKLLDNLFHFLEDNYRLRNYLETSSD
jgi:hypothetical protein